MNLKGILFIIFIGAIGTVSVLWYLGSPGNDEHDEYDTATVCDLYKEVEGGEKVCEKEVEVISGLHNTVVSISEEIHEICALYDIKADISCLDAVSLILIDHPGEVLSISVSTVRLFDLSNPLEKSAVPVWVIELDLDDPIIRPSEKVVHRLQRNVSMQEGFITSTKFIEDTL